MNCILFGKMEKLFSQKKQNINRILVKWKNILESQGILLVQKSGNHVVL